MFIYLAFCQCNRVILQMRSVNLGISSTIIDYSKIVANILPAKPYVLAVIIIFLSQLHNFMLDICDFSDILWERCLTVRNQTAATYGPSRISRPVVGQRMISGKAKQQTSAYAGKPWLRHYDYWVPEQANFPRQPIYQILNLAATQFGERPATVFFNAKLSFGE